jgi:hypothetical protein
MAPAQIPLALVATGLWLGVFFRVRSAFSGVFVQRAPGEVKSVPEEIRRNSSGIDGGRVEPRGHAIFGSGS